MARKKSIIAEYFGLTQDPFGLTPDPAYFYASKTHATALEWLKFAIEQKELGLVIGEIGTGKTVLSRCFIDSLSEEDYRVCWIINPKLSPSAILKEIYHQLFDEKPPYFKHALLKKIQEGLVDLYMNDIYPVIVIDEAQTIPTKAVFDELRLLSNFQSDKENLVSIILLGQIELETRLKRRAYRSLFQRIRFASRLVALSETEIDAYIEKRLEASGYSGAKIFDADAVALLYNKSNGYPRLINNIATFAMLQIVADGRGVVTQDDVEQATKGMIYFDDETSKSTKKNR